ncbi:MAG: HEPN domain-containing protein [Pseudomonadales bacterium]|uniref:HEPN domain-containing protein n=1 Tax=uncultured Umboniibacter sp. TaxID=1798917 RepID=UPI00261E0684|nr:HEPN domain-containing protein [uncultured Umboniibacter sp.]
MDFPTYELLKEYQRDHRDSFNQDIGLRIHRALSWLHRSLHEQDDLDAQFVFLWIAFNSAYAYNSTSEYRVTETEQFSGFISRLVGHDSHQLLHRVLWTHYPNAIRVLLGNKFVFRPFWEAQMGEPMETGWLEQFERANQAANTALGRQDAATVLQIVMTRLYTLRNQILHGGATWNSAVNRDQLRDACALLSELVPCVISIMMSHAGEVWGPAHYPVIEG